jgi:VanZ family protein
MSLWRSGAFRWSAWWLLLAILSWALLSPQPPLVAQALLPSEMTFTASKAVHVTTYAFMTLLVLWLPSSPKQRAVLWVILALHAGLTEAGQTFVPGRYGSFADVLVNLTGLSLGLALALWLSRRREPEPQSS